MKKMRTPSLKMLAEELLECIREWGKGEKIRIEDQSVKRIRRKNGGTGGMGGEKELV